MTAITDYGLPPTPLSSTLATINAAGTDAASATPVTASSTIVVTLTAGGAGVRLPAAQQGMKSGPTDGYNFGPQQLEIYNAGPAACTVYPMAGDATPTVNSIPPCTKYRYKCVAQGSWLCELQVG